MQPDNTELVREVIGALNRGDVDGMLARLDPDFEWTCQVWTLRGDTAVSMEEYATREQALAAQRAAEGEAEPRRSR